MVVRERVLIILLNVKISVNQQMNARVFRGMLKEEINMKEQEYNLVRFMALLLLEVVEFQVMMVNTIK